MPEPVIVWNIYQFFSEIAGLLRDAEYLFNLIVRWELTRKKLTIAGLSSLDEMDHWNKGKTTVSHIAASNNKFFRILIAACFPGSVSGRDYCLNSAACHETLFRTSRIIAAHEDAATVSHRLVSLRQRRGCYFMRELGSQRGDISRCRLQAGISVWLLVRAVSDEYAGTVCQKIVSMHNSREWLQGLVVAGSMNSMTDERLLPIV